MTLCVVFLRGQACNMSGLYIYKLGREHYKLRDSRSSSLAISAVVFAQYRLLVTNLQVHACATGIC
jgi:hypothetical protein